MLSGDIIGVLCVYVYVAILLLISEKVLKKHPFISRKFLHIMVGNIFFMLPLFEHAWVMSFIAAAPFILLTFLFSPYSPLKTVATTSAAGHGLGLVYYSISWTILAYIFFDKPWVISIGIVAMSYGDGFASLMGNIYGKHIYKIFQDTKSIEGSIAMFVFTIVMGSVALAYYGQKINLPVIAGVAFVATIVEAITPKGADNLTVSLASALLYYAIA